jgi:small subunit ribosomal protein S21|tara:strand:- start:361 stop:594 length:234 start_codon:yes stop_codon:yes gene_type:complete
MISIKIGPKQDAKRAMQKLKNRVIAEELFVELKKRRHYLKPSAKKKLKREEAAKQRKKDFNSAVRKAEAQELEDYYS